MSKTFKIVIWLVIIAAVGVIAWKLFFKKEELSERKKLIRHVVNNQDMMDGVQGEDISGVNLDGLGTGVSMDGLL